MHIENTQDFFISLSCNLNWNWRLELTFEYVKINDCVKDVDLEAMPSSIFLKDDDDDDCICSAF